MNRILLLTVLKRSFVSLLVLSIFVLSLFIVVPSRYCNYSCCCCEGFVVVVQRQIVTRRGTSSSGTTSSRSVRKSSSSTSSNRCRPNFVCANNNNNRFSSNTQLAVKHSGSSSSVLSLEGEMSTSESTSTTTVGGIQLKRIVQEAAQYDCTIDSNGIIWLEHINIIVGNIDIAKYFYITFLGCTRDPTTTSFHVNIGQQQFHLAQAKKSSSTNESPQVIYGSIGITIPNLQTLRERIPDAIHVLKDTQFTILVDTNNKSDNIVTVRCPWGNIFHIYSVLDDDITVSSTSSTSTSTSIAQQQEQQQIIPRKMVQMHTTGTGIYGSHRMSIRGQPGIRYIEFKCSSINTTKQIGYFYKQLLHCTTIRSITKTDTNTPRGITLSVGPGIHFVFIEPTESSSSSSSSSSSCGTAVDKDDSVVVNDEQSLIDKMIGVHVCIYINEFVASYKRLRDQQQHYDNSDETNTNPNNNLEMTTTTKTNTGLIWTNPRFVHLDTCATIEEALDSRTFRFKDIIDLSDTDTSTITTTTTSNNNDDDNVDNNIKNSNCRRTKKIYELEHETRSMNHGQFFKLLHYEPK